jgi:glycerophosphoryl diester phosphodiesterase
LEAPENTLAAFGRAIDLGADMIEFDVRRAPDGRLVISHDPVAERPAQDLLTLEDALRFTQGRIQLDVELKEPGCERESIDLLLRYFPVVLGNVRALHPAVRTGLIFAEWSESVGTACRSADVDFLVARYPVLKEAAEIGKPLFVWTVDDPILTRALFQHSLVEAIVTNNSRQALALRRESFAI